METSLHAQLKRRYGSEAGGRDEVWVDGFRIDAVGPDGELVEVQSAGLGPLRPKLRKLLPFYEMRVVKPVVVARRIVRRATRDGPDLSTRMSPRRGALVDLFDDLVGLAPLFPRDGLSLDAAAVAVDEVRVARRRWPGYRVADRALVEVVETVRLTRADDLWRLLPEGEWSARFTTADLAEVLARPSEFARRVAYCLRVCGAAEAVGKAGNRWIYERTGAAAPFKRSPAVAACDAPRARTGRR